ncbi:hypothetical protein AMECASPLE_005288 [Ameca splendens]|uniref:Uncharacterized protein n=1 Tax=Ameca splendens TaxID=208324 RepID=A0ABV0XC62_9TELE
MFNERFNPPTWHPQILRNTVVEIYEVFQDNCSVFRPKTLKLHWKLLRGDTPCLDLMALLWLVWALLNESSSSQTEFPLSQLIPWLPYVQRLACAYRKTRNPAQSPSSLCKNVCVEETERKQAIQLTLRSV